MTQLWNGRRYYSLDSFLKNTFGEKLYKLSLDGGMTCPNRDGTLSSDGCIFCSTGGSGDFAVSHCMNTDEQIVAAKLLVQNKYNGNRYIAYFQSYTNTYAPCDTLRRLFLPVIQRPDIAVLSIATRPDCLPKPVLELLAELNTIKPVWVELGLQTIHEHTAQYINRGYPLEVYQTAAERLHQIGIPVITHMIIGLPNETDEDILQTARYIGKIGKDGIKLQLLHILKGTILAEHYAQGQFSTLSFDCYIDLVCRILSVLPSDMVIHRLTGDGNKNDLIAPLWSGDKRRVLNSIQHELKLRDLWQGKFFAP